MLFPRATKYDKILLGIDSLKFYVESNNGKRNCYISVYAYEKFYNGKAVIQTAIIDALHCKTTDVNNGMKYITKLQLEDIIFTAYYDGLDFNILCPLVTHIDHREVKNLAPKMQEKLGIPFTTETWHYMLWHRTFNTRSKKYCIRIKANDNPESVSIFANRPIKREFKMNRKYIDEI